MVVLLLPLVVVVLDCTFLIFSKDQVYCQGIQMVIKEQHNNREKIILTKCYQPNQVGQINVRDRQLLMGKKKSKKVMIMQSFVQLVFVVFSIEQIDEHDIFAEQHVLQEPY